MNAYDHSEYRRPMRDKEPRPQDLAANQTHKDRMEQQTAEDGRQQRPWQVGFMLRFALHFAFYGWVAWWLLGKPEIPIRWLQ